MRLANQGYVNYDFSKSVSPRKLAEPGPPSGKVEPNSIPRQVIDAPGEK